MKELGSTEGGRPGNSDLELVSHVTYDVLIRSDEIYWSCVSLGLQGSG